MKIICFRRGNVTNPSCGLDCDGSVEVTAIGGSGELTVGYFNQTSGTFFTDSVGLCAGEYIVTGTDTSACETADLFTIEAPDPLGFLIFPFNATCTGMSDGSADSFPKGGTVTLGEWDWFVLDTAGQMANLNNLSEMTYTAHVTDQVGCTYSARINQYSLESTTLVLFTVMANQMILRNLCY